jgi:hypothetical protein
MRHRAAKRLGKVLIGPKHKSKIILKSKMKITTEVRPNLREELHQFTFFILDFVFVVQEKKKLHRY